VLKSVIIFGITIVGTLSLMQKKFPPSFSEASATVDNLNKMTQQLMTFNPNMQVEQMMGSDKIIASRQDMMNQVATLDASMADLKEPVKKKEAAAIKPAPIETVEKKAEEKGDLNIYRIKVDQSEYKIRMLEYEVAVLKTEIQKLKNKTVK
jgi:uncharacterized protein YecE (DUF72 family)